jgi:hypothetical protein
MTRSLLLFLALAALACPSVEPGAASDPDAAPDLLVVVLDTTPPRLVADAMPNAQAFLDAALSWDRAISPSNTTVDSVAGMFQDRFLRTSDLAPGDDSTADVTLAERLHDAGYSTVLASANEALDVGFFARGFDRANVRPRDGEPGRPDPATVSWFLEAWEALPPPRFGWIQLDVGHDYLAAPDDFSWAPAGGAELEDAWGWFAEDAVVTDALLPDLFALVPGDAGLTILVADHGEHYSNLAPFMVGKDDTWGHGNGNAPMEITVPLGLRGPGIAARRIAGAVSTRDVHPTLLAAAGLPARVDLRDGVGQTPAGASLCNLLNLQLNEGAGNMTVLVDDDGGQLVRTHSPDVLPPEDRPPLLVSWPGTGLGRQADWQELSVGDLRPEEAAFLFDEGLPECKGYQDLCDEYPELGAIGYIDCD